MRRRVERAEEAQDRINAPAGANTQGVVSQLRDKVRVRRTPQYMRDDFRAAEAAEAEREAQAQAKQQRRELSREDLARARSLRGFTPQQIEQFRELDPQRVRSLMNLDATLAGAANPYAQVGPTLGQLVPNAQPPQTPVPPLTTAPGAQEALQQGEQVPDRFDDHSSQDQGLAAQLGQQVAQEEESAMGLSADELREALRMGLDGQR